MSSPRKYVPIIHGAVVLVAVLFGIVTLIAGGRVLAGADPGYIVFRPLLIYNVTMGFAYMAAGIIMWRSLDRGRYAAAAIFLLNLVVYIAIVYLYTTGAPVAIDSVRAMTLRTGVWLALFIASGWLLRRR